MTVYAVGDVQGCAVALEELLEAVAFDADADRLWLTGDLVNRGRHSLEVLRLVKNLGDAAVTVLGNHDLHLLAVAAGAREPKPDDTLKKVLSAHDRDELLDWLRRRPLAHFDKATKTMMVHAGVAPGWRRKEVARYAGEVEAQLRGADCGKFLRRMYGRTPAKWGAVKNKWQRARFIINALTRIRFCSRAGALDLAHKGAPGSQPRRLVPWFAHPDARCKNWRIVFGHWSALGLYLRGNRAGLDTGCAWGRELTALRLNGDGDDKLWRVNCSR